MKYNKKPQEGVFIGVFALATLVVISLAIGFLSNRVNDLLRNQGQMIAGRLAYWLAFSGMETVAQDRLGDLVIYRDSKWILNNKKFRNTIGYDYLTNTLHDY